ncbi:hypothetical protein NK984_23765, partial [Salmonella enterica subsp. enterica serovar Typhimurium]|nr:hypothetical protein [Salmonella enterica subsp. enterica serovar Typhimurium]
QNLSLESENDNKKFTSSPRFPLVLRPKFITNTMPALKDIATQLRRDIVRMVHGVSSGHPGGSLGCTEYFTALYFKVMKHNPQFDMDGKGEDLFFLS